MLIPFSQMTRATVAAAALSVIGFAASADALSSTFAFVVVEKNDAGVEELVTRNTVRPGEVIQYQLNHENMTDEDMAGIVVAAPVPEGVTITLGNQTTSINAVFEVQADLDPELDGLEWSTLPAVRMVAGPDGVLREEPLPETEIASVRWTYSDPLEAGKSAVNTYRVRVN